MARQVRVEFPDAVYHVCVRENGVRLFSALSKISNLHGSGPERFFPSALFCQAGHAWNVLKMRIPRIKD